MIFETPAGRSQYSWNRGATFSEDLNAILSPKSEGSLHKLVYSFPFDIGS